MAYRALGSVYDYLGEVERSKEYFTKAFALREHDSEREKLQITGNYYDSVTGEQEKAAKVYQELIENYPRDDRPYYSLDLVYTALGEYEKAIDAFRQCIRLNPDNYRPVADLAASQLAMQQLDEARDAIRQVQLKFFVLLVPEESAGFS
jgi:tetratricopeptide (TPR) repeat protein